MANDRKPGTEPVEDSEEEFVRRPRNRFQRQQDSDLRQVFGQLGIDIDDFDSMKEARADLDYVRNQRQRQQKRIATIWSAVIAAVVSALIGGLGVILTNIAHTGKILP